MSVISVQSQVSFGYVGNSAAVPALQALGYETWPVHTAMVAHHPGHGGFHGAITQAAVLRSIFEGMQDIGAFGRCSALLSGYLGSVENGEALLSAWASIKSAAPAALYCCDPVIGDSEEGIYVDAGLVPFFRDSAMAAADQVVANAFEASILTDVDVTDSRSAVVAARKIAAKGPGVVVISSVPLRVDGKDWLGNIAVDGERAWQTRVPRLQRNIKGAGDFMTALWLGHYLQSRDSASALSGATMAVKTAIDRSAADDGGELRIIERVENWRQGGDDVFLESIG